MVEWLGVILLMNCGDLKRGRNMLRNTLCKKVSVSLSITEAVN